MSDELEAAVPEEIEVPEAEATEAAEAEPGCCDDPAEIVLDEEAFVARVAASLDIAGIHAAMRDFKDTIGTLRAELAALTLVPDLPTDDDDPEDPEPTVAGAPADVEDEDEVADEEPVELLAAAAAPEAPVSTPTVPLATKGDIELLQSRVGSLEERMDQIQAFIAPLIVNPTII